jgi:two-component system sensor histidine kinase AlgZ
MANRPRHKFNVSRVLYFTFPLSLISPFLNYSFGTHVTASQLWRDFQINLVYAGSIGILAHAIMPGIWWWTRCERTLLKWPVVFASLVSIGLVGCSIAAGLLFALGVFQPQDFWRIYVESLKLCVIVTVVFGSCVVVYKSLKTQLEQTTLELRTNELERERALKLATEARLSSLESRIHPHFLFNTLNSISSLIQDDPQRAERLIERMAALLRFSLDSGRSGLVPLHQEIKIVSDYLEIEKARFGDRLRYEVDLPPELQNLEVLPLSVQTLVENSVKYAVSTRREGGLIRVAVAKTQGRLEVEVCDDGPGFGIDAVLAGHGIDNLQARLLTLFGMNAGLDLKRTERGMSVVISMPATPDSRLIAK